MTRNNSLQTKLTQKPTFKKPRKRANPQLSSVPQNKINKYFITIHNKSERGTGGGIGPSNKHNFIKQDLAKHDEVTPEGQVDQDQDRQFQEPRR